MKNYNLHDHKLNAENPCEINYFPPERLIPVSTIDMHPAIHLGVLLNGHLKFWIDGCEREIKKGEVWLTAPLEPHTSLSYTADREAVTATFQLEEFGRVFAPWKLPLLRPLALSVPERHEILCGKANSEIFDLALRLKKSTMEEPSSMYAASQWLILHRLYLEILKLFENVPSLGNSTSALDRLRPALMLPRTKPGVPVTLEEAAAACSLSQGRFGDLFRIHTGTTFGRYEMQYRLSGARNDVVAGTKTLKEISADWGFYDESHFLRVFRGTYGCTPRAYRRKHDPVQIG